MKKQFFNVLCLVFVLSAHLSAAEYQADWERYKLNPNANQRILKRLIAAEHVGALRVNTEAAIAKLEKDYEETEAKLKAEQAKNNTQQTVNMEDIKKFQISWME